MATDTVTTERDTTFEQDAAAYFARLDKQTRRDAFEGVNAGVKLMLSPDELPRADGLPEPELFRPDLSKPAPPPRYAVANTFEYETVNLIAGDGGSSKSTQAARMAVAAVKGEDWIGRQVNAERVLYLDEENPARVPHARLRALGLTNEDWDALRYYSRQGIVLGDGEGKWEAWLESELETFRPGLVFIDGAQACTTVEVNDNDSVVALYRVLRRLASAYDAAIVLIHHARKPGLNGGDDTAGMNTMGARQFHNQADRHITFKVGGPFESEPTKSGGDTTRREFVMTGNKDRMDDEGGAELVILTSGRSRTKALEWMRIESGGPAANRKDAVARAISDYVCEEGRTLTTKEIAEGVGKDSTDSTFERGLKAAHEEDGARIKKAGHGKYEPAALGV
jgi:AAA domain